MRLWRLALAMRGGAGGGGGGGGLEGTDGLSSSGGGGGGGGCGLRLNGTGTGGCSTVASRLSLKVSPSLSCHSMSGSMRGGRGG